MEEKDRRCPRGKLHCFNWLEDIPGTSTEYDIVEVQFKNTRKGYYRNSLNLPLETGDMVAVEASPGHDIGSVTLTGKLVALQMRRAGVKNEAEIKRVFRKAKPADIEKYEEARARENDTMIRARKIAESLSLNMKIGDVEYQGDGNKAIFYYIADERVDFRQLIKVLADTFKVRIEMKQIGARQEAGRIGGIGSCGRPLCCASWMTNFVSVGTSAARYQDISLNPQKLAGQCGKLKCCLNYETAVYMDAQSRIPKVYNPLEFEDGLAYLMKTDILKETMYFSYDQSSFANLYALSAQEVWDIIRMNRNGVKPESLKHEDEPVAPEFVTAVGDDAINRFDEARKRKKKRKPAGRQGGNAGQGDGAVRKFTRPAQDGEAKASGSAENRETGKRHNDSRGGRGGNGRPDGRRNNWKSRQGERQADSGEHPRHGNAGGRARHTDKPADKE